MFNQSVKNCTSRQTILIAEKEKNKHSTIETKKKILPRRRKSKRS